MINGIGSEQLQIEDLLKICVQTKDAPSFHTHLRNLNKFVKEQDISKIDFNSHFLGIQKLIEGIFEIVHSATGKYFENIAIEIVDLVLNSHWDKIEWSETIFNEFNSLAVVNKNSAALKYYTRIARMPGINWNSTKTSPRTPLLKFLSAFNNKQPMSVQEFEQIINLENLDWFAACDGWTPFWQLCILTKHDYLIEVAKPKILQIIKSSQTLEEQTKLNQCLTSSPKERPGVSPLGFMADNIRLASSDSMRDLCSKVLYYALNQGSAINWNYNNNSKFTTPFKKLLECPNETTGNYEKPSKIFNDLVLAINGWDVTSHRSSFGVWFESHFSILLDRFLRDPQWYPIIEDFILSNPSYDFPQNEKKSLVMDKCTVEEHPALKPDLKQNYRKIIAKAKKALDSATRNEYIEHLIALNASQQVELYKDGADFDVLPPEVQDIVFSYLRRPAENPINLVQFRTVFVKNCRVPQLESPEQALAKLQL